LKTYKFTDKANKQSSFFFNILLLIWLAHLSTNLIWQSVELLDAEPKYAIQNLKNIIKKQNQTLSLPIHLFGIVDKKNITYQKTKNTRLNLNLIGILNQGKKSLAIIKYKSKDNIYQIGDTIASGVTIKDIKIKYIILSRHGDLEKLLLTQKSIKKFVTNNNNKVSKLSVSQKNKVKKYQKQLLTNPVSLFALVGIKPKYINNRLSGFSLFPTKERKLFYDLGFKKDDILIEINQNKFTSINQAMQLGKELANQTDFDLTVKRNQQIKILSISL
jgi:general secretion pathway protein C